MEQTNTENTEAKRTLWSEEKTLNLIRQLRNDLVKDFLDERYILEYFANQYNRKELTTAKVQFIKKALKELLIAPVDKVHYAELIAQLQDTGTASISRKHEELFLKDIEKVLKQYAF